MTLPAITTFDQLGGEKTDYYPVENSNTDRSDTEVNSAFANISALTYVSAKCILVFNPVNLTVTYFKSVWGDAQASYPTITRPSTGNYVITFNSTVSDFLGDTHTLSFQFATVQAQSYLPPIIGVYTTSNTVNIYNYSTVFGLENSTSTLAVAIY